jgi:hypothetical protein
VICTTQNIICKEFEVMTESQSISAQIDKMLSLQFESFSNITDSSDLHDPKHDLQRMSTDDGISIDFNPDFENADS